MRASTARLVAAIDETMAERFGNGFGRMLGNTQRRRREGLFEIREKAQQDYYHDFFGKPAMPEMELYKDFAALGFDDLAHRVTKGEFDATKEESDEWAQSPDGLMAMMDDHAGEKANEVMELLRTVEGQQHMNDVKRSFGMAVNPLFKDKHNRKK